MHAIAHHPLPRQPGASGLWENTGQLKRLYLCLLWLLAAAALPVPAESDIPPGIYFMMAVGFNPDTRLLTGYYENHAGWDEETQSSRFSCIFYLRGKIEGEPPYKITTWYPSDPPEQSIPGELNVSDNGGNFFLTVRLDDEHGGCGSMDGFTAEEGVDLRLEEEMPWREIRVIASATALLHDTPSADSITTGSLAAGTPVGVLDFRPGWVFVEEQSEDQIMKGWISLDDLFPVSQGN